MPIRVCKVDDLTPHTRNKNSVVNMLPEFTEIKTKLSNGLDLFEAIEVSLPHSDKRGFKHIRQTLKRHVSDYLKNLKLTHYTVETYSAHGKDLLTIANIPPMNGRKVRAMAA